MAYFLLDLTILSCKSSASLTSPKEIVKAWPSFNSSNKEYQV
jgi:hypothetical protein